MQLKLEELYDLYLNSSGVSTDSRTLKGSEIFFALKGENFNGNLFATDALAKGAKLVVADDPSLQNIQGIHITNDSLKTLQDLAGHHRKVWGGQIFAITGSNGKTTTKELVAAVLSGKFNILATEGNLNNHIGVPLTLLKLEKEELAVIEMGANHQGEIARLCEIATPDTGMITNIGKAHMEGFGGLKGIEKGKGEMYDFLTVNGGTGIVDFSSETLQRMATERNMKTFTYGRREDLDVHGELTGTEQGLKGSFMAGEKRYPLQSNLFGAYNFQNMLAAAATGIYYGVDPEHITASIAAYQSDNNRSQVLHGKSNTIIQDAYNANPTSMTLALQSFLGEGIHNKMVILGDMLETGEKEQEEHRNIISLLEEYNIEKAFLVGERFMTAAAKSQYRTFNTINDCMEYLRNDPPHGLQILIKGSRKNQLEKATKWLLDC